VPKFTRLDDRLHDYLLAHRSPDEALLDELRAETRARFGPRSGMQIAAEQGSFLGILVAATGARRVVEVGTFTGMSALCMARALPPGGTLLALDVNDEYTEVARRFWRKAGMADRIELRIGPALDALRALPQRECFDFAFIDADKENYSHYFDEILLRLRPHGLICVDNVLWGGRVIDPAADDSSTLAIRAFNDRVARDARVQCVMIGLSDGLTIARKLPGA
jgi:caffeoyl-CoA O-methyltransferase